MELSKVLKPVKSLMTLNHDDGLKGDNGLSVGPDAILAKGQLPQARTPHEQTALERQIEATDRQIDALVYELYALTEEEIGIVEGVS